MKKIGICLLMFIIMTTGCKKDPLDITPDGRITLDDVFKNETQTEAFLNTVYDNIPSYGWKYQFFSYLAGATDEVSDSDIGNEGSNIASQWNSGSLTPSNNPLAQAGQGNAANHYPAFWNGIRKANIFLSYIDKAKVTNDIKRARLKAEAKLLRAFYYLELIKQFGAMPLVDRPFENTFDYKSLKRASFQENIDFIVKDCDDAISTSSLPIRITLEPERGRFTKAVAYAIKSQALLYNASPLWNPENNLDKWRAAAEATQTGLTALTANGQYELMDNYGDYFLSQSDINSSPRDRESIFERPEASSGTFTIINSIPSKSGAFKAGSCPSQELVDSYDMQASGEPAITGYTDADHLHPIINTASGYSESAPYVGRDPRFYATVWYNGALYDNIQGAIHTIETFAGGSDQLLKSIPNRLNTHTGYYLRKFIDPKLQSGQVHNSRWKKYRLAELYLNLAEAENEASGPNKTVYDAIEVVRKRANMPAFPAGLNQVQMRERIRKERRVEFAIEEHRFWDVRRWKILDQTDKAVTGMEITRNGSNFLYKRFVVERRSAWQDKFRIFPLPIDEVSNIPNFAENQNPGW